MRLSPRVGIALSPTAIHRELRPERFELRQGNPSLIGSIEQAKSCACGVPEFLQCDRAVEVGIGSGDGLGHVEQCVTSGTLERAAHRKAAVDLGIPLPPLPPGQRGIFITKESAAFHGPRALAGSPFGA
jgi:hypothetical protein